MKKIIIVLAMLTLLVPAVSAQKSDVRMTESSWNGCARYDYQIQGRDAIVVVPANPAPGNPWIWRPAFFNAFPSVDKALLKEGWHIAYYDVTHCYGSPESVRLGHEFYEDAVARFGLNEKVTVEGFSRGGFYAFAWAETYPETVASLYVDAPVCDMLLWPGRGGKLWLDFLKNWKLEDKDVPDDFIGNAIHRIDTIVRYGIPIMGVCGGADEVVPFDRNFKIIREAYQAKGGIVEMIVKPECGHHPHSLENPEPVVDFIKRYAPGYTDKQDIHLRGTLDNAMYAMAVRKKACVAFLGGSITEMRGWRDMIKEDLQQRFPDTEFDFIEAGIASLGSTPHAFRFEKDVLGHGTPDLLFVEAVVNDHTNEFTPRAQVRGMEGVVRHALAANPSMDIVMLDFIHDPFVQMMESGEMPDVVFNHERVANRYHITSINLVQEIYDRIASGELAWKDFGGTHPSWLGHKYYAAAINKVLDANTKPVSEYAVKPHAIPEALDAASYDSGELVSIEAARNLKGFAIDECWDPDDKVGKRPGFFKVPMLSTVNGGSLKFDFDGRAVGIFCVAGPDAAVIKYRVDNGDWKYLDTFTKWSKHLYLPWVYMLAEDLPSGKHTLEIKIPNGERQGCHIRDFVVNK